MIYKAKIINMSLKQVTVKDVFRAILSVKYQTTDEELNKNFVQDLWVPSSSTKEKAVNFFKRNLETIGIEKSDFKNIYRGKWGSTLKDLDFEFEIETEIGTDGYEKVKYVNDPSNPHNTGQEITDLNLLKDLGLEGEVKSSPDFEESDEEIPF